MRPPPKPLKRPGTSRKRSRPAGRFSFLTEMVVLFAVALTIALLIKTFVVQPFYIPSGSMMNTLLVGDKVLVNKLVYHVRPIDRGNVIVFDGAGSWDPPGASQPITTTRSSASTTTRSGPCSTRSRACSAPRRARRTTSNG